MACTCLNMTACCWQQKRQLLSWMPFRVVPPQNGISFHEKAPATAVILEFGAVKSCTAGFFQWSMAATTAAPTVVHCTLQGAGWIVVLTVPTVGLLGQHSYTGLFCNTFWLEIYTDGYVANICTSALFPRLVCLAIICTSALFPRPVYLANIVQVHCSHDWFIWSIFVQVHCSHDRFIWPIFVQVHCSHDWFIWSIFVQVHCSHDWFIWSVFV